MKNCIRHISFVCLILSAIMCGSCVFENGKDDPEDSPRLILFNGLYPQYVRPVFRYAELVSFFSEYQEIRSDRAASEALFMEYFGYEPDRLFYEKAEVYGWGVISLDNEGLYNVRPNYYTDEAEYDVALMAGGGYILKSPWALVSDNIVFTFEDGSVFISSFEVAYADESGSSVKMGISDGKPLVMKICRKGNAEYYPASGCIDVTVEGKDINDSFSVVFTGGNMLIL